MGSMLRDLQRSKWNLAAYGTENRPTSAISVTIGALNLACGDHTHVSDEASVCINGLR